MIDPKPVIDGFEKAVEFCGAKKIQTVVHSFGEDQGFTAFIMLAESHVAIHTWPEREYVSLDVYMCGSCNPYKVIPFVESLFGYSYTLKAIPRDGK